MEKIDKYSDKNLLPLMAIFGLIFLALAIGLATLAFTELYGIPTIKWDALIGSIVFLVIGVLMIIPFIKSLLKNKKN